MSLEKDKIKELLESGRPVREILKELDLTVGSFYRLLEKTGLKHRREREDSYFPKSGPGAYLLGVLLGDGDLSLFARGVYRLRLYQDSRYPSLIKKWVSICQVCFPNNKVSVSPHTSGKCTIIAVYSKGLDNLPFSPGKGKKCYQKMEIPAWVLEDRGYCRDVITGLIESDGCIYRDNIKSYSYTRVSFSTSSEDLKNFFVKVSEQEGFSPYVKETKAPNCPIEGEISKKVTSYTLRILNGEDFMKRFNLAFKR